MCTGCVLMSEMGDYTCVHNIKQWMGEGGMGHSLHSTPSMLYIIITDSICLLILLVCLCWQSD